MPSSDSFVISKTFSDGISLQKDGPKLSSEHGTTRLVKKERSYKVDAYFIPKMVAKHFVTTLTVDDEWTYYECIEFRREVVMKKFSETTNIFSPEISNAFCTTVYYDPSSTKKHFITGIELFPEQRVVVSQEIIPELLTDATACNKKAVVNGEMNGDIKDEL